MKTKTLSYKQILTLKAHSFPRIMWHIARAYRFRTYPRYLGLQRC